MKPMTYSMQFRGHTREIAPGLLEAVLSAPSCAHFTTVGIDGLDGRFLTAPGGEARCDSHLRFADAETFDEEGTLSFGHGNSLRFRAVARGQLGPSPDPHLSHGTVVWEIESGEGQFEGARGRITSNFFVSDTGEVTDNQFGVIFLYSTRRRDFPE